MELCFLGFALPLMLLYLTANHVVSCSRIFRQRSLSSNFCQKNTQEKSSFLWGISKNISNSRRPFAAQITDSYFFGTVHVPYSKVWDYVSQATKKAFEEADHVVFELDLTDDNTIQTLSKCQMLPDGHNLSMLLPGDLYERLKNQLNYVENMMPVWTSSDQRGQEFYAGYLYSVMTNNWENKRPIWVMLMLNSLTESDIKSRGAPVLDLYLAQEAARMQKHIGAVERVEEQCLPLNNMNLSQVIFALDQSLLQHETMRKGRTKNLVASSTEDLINHYRCGDLDSVIYGRDSSQIASPGWSAKNDQGKAIEEYFRVELLQKRNRRMAKRVVELLQTYPKRKFFFAFGAGHFLGNHSVIAYMEEMGYTISHLSTNHQIKSAASSRSKNQRKNRQRTSVVLSASALGTSYQLRNRDRFRNAGELSKESDRLMANSRSDYVDALAYERERKRKPQALGAGELSNRRRIPPEYSQFNDLWITTTISTPKTGSTQSENNYFYTMKQRTHQLSGVKSKKGNILLTLLTLSILKCMYGFHL